ncbi:hypothetical protein K7X08_034143 [Anisodus acutangulus]|uniref:Uncharacterized protein n=1 Tax=Anisodus acutangulus TaxID=402998 RepID=A0A9Q1RDQ9_9SOLA|nr:hypothetical protein K7X08_034143 [Anisodus acutangulus]
MLVSEVGPIYIGGKTEHVFNVDEYHISLPELADYCKSFGVVKLGKTYAVPSQGGDLVELKKDRDIYDIALFLHDGDTIDIYMCAEGQCSPVTSVLLSTLPIIERVETEEVEDSDYSSIDWTNSEEEEVTPTFQENDAPIVQEETEYIVQENADDEKQGVGNDDDDSDQYVDYDSDAHEELRIVKQDLRKFNREDRRNKKKEKTKGFLGEVGPDEGYDDIDKVMNLCLFLMMTLKEKS